MIFRPNVVRDVIRRIERVAHAAAAGRASRAGVAAVPAFMLAVAALLAAGAPAPARAQSGAPAVRVLEGAASPTVTVSVNRAIVLEAGEPFAEVSVANPGIADVAALSNRTVYVLGKTAGRTTLTLFGPGGRLISNVSVQVGPDLQEFKERLQQILPGEDIQARSAADGVVLSGTVSSAAYLARALELAERYAPGRVSNMMSVGGSQQVLLRVRFAEVQRSASKSLGFNWSVGFGFGNFGVSSAQGDYANADNVRGVPTQRGLSTPYAASNPAEGIMRIGYAAGGIVANLAIDALESKGFARTLAEPNLVALSGDDASFLAGGEYPVPVYSAEDGNLSVDYRPFGVSLGFTPTVVSAEVINLELEAESSAIDTSIVIANNGVQFNGFSTRRAKTTIELKDGESFAIAGLLQDEFVDNANQLPWVGDVPILGTLFRSADFQRRQTELVIIVTAYLISPVTEDAIELPTDRIRLPSEEDLFLLGKLGHAADPVIRSVAGREFEGAYGYVVE
ncbi:pilus assembly protein CpaC [Albimonas donghaensis]|uniref:Pilus assembly protein CpaC n=2 Tax=Albimonas donghaensis TaxID=356660 RepID=A0A1H3E7E6_9RHOB|nr:type II and III secretion system protein family protein [Albimonas donghaensis]SDX73854.1 pilus assembly protein CpaC [Albimonas donghaensis]